MSGPTTDQRSSPTRLQPSYLDALFEGARLAIIACEPNGGILAWNAAASGLFTQLESGNEGRPVADLFPEKDRATVTTQRQACVETLDIQEFEWECGESPGSPIVYGVWWTPVLSDNGEPQGVALWFRDITQRVRLKRAVETRQRLNVLGSLAGAVAHHYSNLLCSIATTLEYASNMTTTSAMKRALQRTGDVIVRATEITRQLLAFARADHSEQTYSDVTEATLYYFDENEEKLAQRGVKLRLDWRRVPMVPVPREQFGVVLDNLTRNALDAMPNGGVLSVAISPHDRDNITISVTDTGCGIPPGALEHLFEPFFTTKGVLGSGSARNAGMGLAVVHGFVAEMGGVVTAGNVSGGGARFEIILPVKQRDELDI